MKKIIVGITGASGSVYAIDLLEKLHQLPQMEIHLVVSPWAKENIKLESQYSLADITNLADVVYNIRDMGAAIASGSFKTDGMVIVPASMKTIAALSIGYTDNLITRAADVVLKEQRKLIIVPRETPLSAIHLENLTKLARLGVHVIPPVPAFYNHPQTIQDLITHQSMKILDSLGLDHHFGHRWKGE